MKTNKKELYLTPEAEVFEVKIEGVICGSGRRNSYGNANEGVDPSSLEDGVWEW